MIPITVAPAPASVAPVSFYDLVSGDAPADDVYVRINKAALDAELRGNATATAIATPSSVDTQSFSSEAEAEPSATWTEPNYTAPMCSRCEETAAQWNCTDCESVLCEICKNELHEKGSTQYSSSLLFFASIFFLTFLCRKVEASHHHHALLDAG